MAAFDCELRDAVKKTEVEVFPETGRE